MRRSHFLVLTLTMASILGWFINAHGPDTFLSVMIFSLISFFTLLFLSLTISRNFFRSLLVSICVTSIFLFRGMYIRHPGYTVLLILFFILVGILYERVFSRKHQR